MTSEQASAKKRPFRALKANKTEDPQCQGVPESRGRALDVSMVEVIKASLSSVTN